LRKEAEVTLAAISELTEEHEVRKALRELNERIAEAIRTPMSGPPLRLSPLDTEAVVRRWRSGQGG